MQKILDLFSSAHSGKALKILVILAMVLFVVAILVFWFGSSSFTERGVEIKLEGPEQALSGDQAVYKISYNNTTRTELKDVSFRFTYPAHSIVIKGENEYSENTTEVYTLDELGTGQKGEKEFKAFLVGERGSILHAKVEMTYKAGSLNSSFEKKPVTIATTITGLPVPVTLSVPPTAVTGQEVTYTLDYRNESGADIADLRFQFTYPNGFVPKRFSPQPTTGDARWDVVSLKRGAGARIVVTGTLSGKEKDNKTVAVVVQRKVNNSYLNYERTEASTIISSPLLTLNTTVNGSRDYTASPGDDLTYAIQYRNASTYTISGLNLLVKLEGAMYDFNSIDPRDGYYDSATNTIVWNAGGVSNLGNLGPAQGGRIEFRVRVKASLGTGSSNFFAKATSTLTTSDIPAGLDTNEISVQDSLITKISTQPTINQSMYYNDPAFGSFGPMPLRVGQETLFTVHWKIVNPGNAINNTVAKAILPTGVIWKNVVSSAAGQNQPSYNPTTRQVTWNMGQLPGGTTYESSFQIGIVPSSTQRGSAPTLLRTGTLSGTDSFTGQSIILNLEELTTSDTIDRSNDGIVE